MRLAPLLVLLAACGKSATAPTVTSPSAVTGWNSLAFIDADLAFRDSVTLVLNGVVWGVLTASQSICFGPGPEQALGIETRFVGYTDVVGNSHTFAWVAGMPPNITIADRADVYGIPHVTFTAAANPTVPPCR